MIALLVIGIVVFVIAYRLYGRFLDRQFNIDPNRTTPAHILNDGIDFMPSNTAVLMGHHFSSIAGACKLVGDVYHIGHSYGTCGVPSSAIPASCESSTGISPKATTNSINIKTSSSLK